MYSPYKCFEEDGKIYMQTYRDQNTITLPFNIEDLNKYPYLTDTLAIKVNALDDIRLALDEHYMIYGCKYDDDTIEWSSDITMHDLRPRIQNVLEIIHAILVEKRYMIGLAIETDFDDDLIKYVKFV